ncbi:hypothetical protein AGE06_16825, partial [Salmonella enterica subsp. enterica serovar Kentucky]
GAGMGLFAGLFCGFACGMGGRGAAVLGLIAPLTIIFLVYKFGSSRPLRGILPIFYPKNRQKA